MTQSEDPAKTLRDDAENQLSRTPDHSIDLAVKTPDQIIHELRMHQIELEIQNEELKKAHLNLEVSLGDVTVDNKIPEKIEVYADPIIRKVITTLMENAIRQGEDITNIRLTISEREEILTISCEDDELVFRLRRKSIFLIKGTGDILVLASFSQRRSSQSLDCQSGSVGFQGRDLMQFCISII